jgi:hypothetical protein
MSDHSNVEDSRPCPMCGYEMRGLPEVYNCPECGFECDPLTVVFRVGPPARNPYSICFGVAALLMLLSSQTGPIFEVNIAILGLMAIGLGAPLFRKERRKRFTSALVIDRTGVRADDAEARMWAIPWKKIARAHCSGVTGVLTLYDHRDTQLLTLGGRFLGTSRMSKRCAAEINRLLVAYRERDFASDESST